MDSKIKSKAAFEELCFYTKAIELVYSNHVMPPIVQNMFNHLSQTMQQESKKHKSKKMVPFGIELLETYHTGNDVRRAEMMTAYLTDSHDNYSNTIYRADKAWNKALALFKSCPPPQPNPAPAPTPQQTNDKKVRKKTPRSNKNESKGQPIQDYLPAFRIYDPDNSR